VGHKEVSIFSSYSWLFSLAWYGSNLSHSILTSFKSKTTSQKNNLLLHNKTLSLKSMTETACKNQRCHSAALRRISSFSFQIKRRDPSAYSFRMIRKGKLARILEQAHRVA